MPTIAITGCSTGFGRVTTMRFLRSGWRVVATTRKASDRENLLDEARTAGAEDRLTVVLADITQGPDVARLRDAVGRRLDVLVNNAGTAFPGPLEILPLDDLRAQLEINVIAHLAVTQALLPALKAARGRIVNVSSISGKIASPGIGAYSASKFALEAISDVLRVELAPFGVQVAVIEPGSSPTEIWKTSSKRSDRQLGGLGDYAPMTEALRKFAAEEAKNGFPPEVFADTVWKIATTKKLRTRYPIPGAIKWTVLLRRFLSDRFIDNQIQKVMQA